MSVKGKAIDFLFNQMRDGTGSLAGGTATFYAPATTTKKPVYVDRDLTTEAANPYTLSANGTAELYANGLYRIVIKDSTGVTVYDYDYVEFADIASNTAISKASVFASASGGDVSATWSAGTGSVVVVKTDNTANTVTISPPAGTTLSVDPDPLSVQGESIRLELDGTTYYPV